MVTGDIRKLYKLINIISDKECKTPEKDLSVNPITKKLIAGPEGRAATWYEFLNSKYAPTQAELEGLEMSTLPERDQVDTLSQGRR